MVMPLTEHIADWIEQACAPAVPRLAEL
jgi:hypothetical protein